LRRIRSGHCKPATAALHFAMPNDSFGGGSLHVACHRQIAVLMSGTKRLGQQLRIKELSGESRP
jgi:hypothetical protein